MNCLQMLDNNTEGRVQRVMDLYLKHRWNEQDPIVGVEIYLAYLSKHCESISPNYYENFYPDLSVDYIAILHSNGRYGLGYLTHNKKVKFMDGTGKENVKPYKTMKRYIHSVWMTID